MMIWRWLLLFKTNDNDCLLLFTIVYYCLRPSYCNDNDCLLLFLLLCDCHYNSIVIYTHRNMTSPAMLQQGPYPEEASTWPENLQSILAIFLWDFPAQPGQMFADWIHIFAFSDILQKANVWKTPWFPNGKSDTSGLSNPIHKLKSEMYIAIFHYIRHHVSHILSTSYFMRRHQFNMFFHHLW